jgi:hypothetical protein
MEETNEIEARKMATDMVTMVNTLKVVDRTSYELMANSVLALRKAVKYFEELYRPRIQQSDAVTKALREDMRKLQARPLEAQEYGDKQLSDWDTEQDRIAQLEQLRLQAEGTKRDEEERLQLAALAEQAGDKALAEEIINTPSREPVVVVHKNVPKIEGLSYREDWKPEITVWQSIPPRYHRMEKNPKGEWHCHVMQDVAAEVKRLKSTAKIPGVKAVAIKVPIGRG